MSVNKINPPTLALWVLRHGCFRPYDEAFVGDLIERFREGQTRGWFWRQVFIAFAFSIVGGQMKRMEIICRVCMLLIALAWTFMFSISMEFLFGLSTIGLIYWLQLGLMLALVVSVLTARAYPLLPILLCACAELLWMSSILFRFGTSGVLSHGVLATRLLLVLLGISLANWASSKSDFGRTTLDPGRTY
jgi:hypothetical protein